VTPVASSPVALMVTVYFSVSPGSALLSLSTSVKSESVLVAVTVGVNGASIGLEVTECFGFTGLAALAEFRAGSCFVGETDGCVFHNQPALLDSTEIDKAIAANATIPAISSGADLFDLVSFEYLRRPRGINPGRFSLRGIRYSFYFC